MLKAIFQLKLNQNNFIKKIKKDYSKINEFYYKSFFKTADRKVNKKEDLISKSGFRALLEEIFNDIYSSSKLRLESRYSLILENNLMKILLNLISKKDKINKNQAIGIGIYKFNVT